MYRGLPIGLKVIVGVDVVMALFLGAVSALTMLGVLSDHAWAALSFVFLEAGMGIALLYFAYDVIKTKKKAINTHTILGVVLLIIALWVYTIFSYIMRGYESNEMS